MTLVHVKSNDLQSATFGAVTSELLDELGGEIFDEASGTILSEATSAWAIEIIHVQSGIELAHVRVGENYNAPYVDVLFDELGGEIWDELGGTILSENASLSWPVELIHV